MGWLLPLLVWGSTEPKCLARYGEQNPNIWRTNLT